MIYFLFLNVECCCFFVKECNIKGESTISPLLYTTRPIRLQIFCTLAIRDTDHVSSEIELRTLLIRTTCSFLNFTFIINKNRNISIYIFHYPVIIHYITMAMPSSLFCWHEPSKTFVDETCGDTFSVLTTILP